MLDKITRNVVRSPSEEKFRCLKLTNPKIASSLASAPAFLDVLLTMGWRKDGETMVLPGTVRLAHEVHVVGLIEGKDYFKKALETEKKRQLRSSKAADEDREQLIKRMKLDRVEKDA